MSPARSLRRLLVLAVLFAQSGCFTATVPVNHLREAQEAFGAAATLENDLLLNPAKGDATDVATGMAAARTGYAAALRSIEEIGEKQKAQLESDKLWGAVVTLRALCQWRLGLYNEALQTAQEARREAGDQLMPRDAAMVEALPALIKNDLAYNQIVAAMDLEAAARRLAWEGGTSAADEPVPSVRDRLGEALDELEAARKKVDSEHPVQIYLLQSQLATFRNYRLARLRLSGGDASDADKKRKIQAGQHITQLEGLLQKNTDPAQVTAIIQRWKSLTGHD